jgi:hypothetical protein
LPESNTRPRKEPTEHFSECHQDKTRLAASPPPKFNNHHMHQPLLRDSECMRHTAICVLQRKEQATASPHTRSSQSLVRRRMHPARRTERPARNPPQIPISDHAGKSQHAPCVFAAPPPLAPPIATTQPLKFVVSQDIDFDVVRDVRPGSRHCCASAAFDRTSRHDLSETNARRRRTPARIFRLRSGHPLFPVPPVPAARRHGRAAISLLGARALASGAALMLLRVAGSELDNALQRSCPIRWGVERCLPYTS